MKQREDYSTNQAMQGIAKHTINASGFNEFQAKFPLVWKSAEGIYVTDLEGKKYLDTTSGWFSANMGHNNPRLTQALVNQAHQFWGVSSGFSHEARERFVYALAQELPANLSRIVMGSSGAEANEIVMQILREYSGDKGIIAFTGSFHGKTYATRHLGGNVSFRKHISSGPSPVQIYRAEYPYPYRTENVPNGTTIEDYCIESLQRSLDDTRNPLKNISALIIEPAQGVGGFIVPPENFLAKVREFCTRNNIVMIADEVITGFGRCGPLYYSLGQGVTPDILVSGKGIANGLSMSAVIIDEALFSKLNMKGGHINHYGSTTSGNPLCCAVATEALSLFKEGNFAIGTAEKGNYLRQSLERELGGFEEVGEVRGAGLMVGIELVKDRKSKEPAKELGQKLYAECLQRNMIINVGGSYGNVVKLAPPLVITENQIDELTDKLVESMKVAVRK